jgi:hypothetical protein
MPVKSLLFPPIVRTEVSQQCTFLCIINPSGFMKVVIEFSALDREIERILHNARHITFFVHSLEQGSS